MAKEESIKEKVIKLQTKSTWWQDLEGTFENVKMLLVSKEKSKCIWRSSIFEL